MKKLRFLLLLFALLVTNLSFAGVLAYVTNLGDNTVSVIDTVSNTVIATIPVGVGPAGIVITPSGTKAYVANFTDGTVTVINTLTNTVLGPPITVGAGPLGIAVTPERLPHL